MKNKSTLLRVLLVEDNESDGALVIRHLTQSDFDISFVRVETAKDFREALRSHTWDIVISDYSLPQFNAHKALEILQETGIDIPFVVVSGTIGEDTAVDMMRSGAQDYLMKNNLTRLIPAVTRELSDAVFRREHKHAESARRESEAKFKAVFENSVDALGISHNGVHVFINPAYTSLFGYPSTEEILGLPIIQLIASEERARILDFVKRRSNDSSAPREYVTRGLRKDGTTFDMEVRVRLVDIDGEIDTLVIIRDITARRREEERLLEAKQKEEESSLLKSTLMMNMSHEVRTPMNAILGFSSIISSESQEAEIREMADRIRLSGDRLMKTLDDILELTQLQTGIETLDLVAVDLEAELRKITDKFTAFASRKNLALKFISGDHPLVCIQKSLFEKAISEIVNNAIKFTMEGSVTIKLNGITRDGGQVAEIRVCDTGIGIAKEYHGAIFESFRQVSGGYGRSYEGTGLGLTIAKKIVELLQGEIFVESEPGKGSAFIIRLSCASQSIPGTEPSPETGKAIHEAPEKSAAVKTGTPMVLLVEDNEDNVFVTTEFCKGICTVQAASTGPEALELMKHQKYNLILMDINLGPGMNGFELAGEIRNKKEYEAIPIVALTGLTFREDRERLLAGGCDYYLGKPFSRNELVNLIREIFPV